MTNPTPRWGPTEVAWACKSAGVDPSEVLTLLLENQVEAEAATPDAGLRAALEHLRAFVKEQAIRGRPTIEVYGNIMAEIDRLLSVSPSPAPLPHQHVGPLGTVTCYAAHSEPPHDLVPPTPSPAPLDVSALDAAQRLVDVIFAEAQSEPYVLPLRGMRAASDLRRALARLASEEAAQETTDD
jgi:hypothetical protein